MATAYRSRHSRSAEPVPRLIDGRRTDLQGLRGLAVMLVLACHAGVPFLPGGYVGVDVFFVLSGFLITGLLVRDYAETGRVRIGHFYARRARRILPTSTLVIVATTIAGIAVLGVDASRDLVVDAAWAALMAGNVHLIAAGNDYFASGLPSLYQQYWSLAVEEQYYLIWPLLMAVALIIGRRWLTPRIGALIAVGGIAAGSFLYSMRITPDDPAYAYYATATRAWELGAGALLALTASLLPRIGRKTAGGLLLLGIACIGAASVTYGPTTPYPGTAALLPVLGTLLIIGAGLDRHIRGNPLTSKTGVWLGDNSYATYLWHWPLLILPAYITGTRPGLGVSLALVAIAIALGWLTTIGFEGPVRRALSDQGPLTVAGVAAFLLAGPVIVMSPLLTIPPPNTIGLTAATASDVVSKVSTQTSATNMTIASVAITDRTRPALNQLSRDTGAHVENNCMSPTNSTAVLTCDFGNPNGTRHVTVFGDSHAGMWIPGLDAWGREHDTRITLLAKTSCSPWQLSMWNRRLDQPHRTCDPWRTQALAYLATVDTDLILVSGNVSNIVLDDEGTPVGDPQAVNRLWRAGAGATLDQLRQTGHPIAVMQDVPAFTHDILACLATNRDDTRPCDEIDDPSTYLQRLSIESETAAAYGADVIPTYNWFCHAGTCPLVINDIIVYRDNGGHISATYSTWLAGALGDSIAPHLPRP